MAYEAEVEDIACGIRLWHGVRGMSQREDWESLLADRHALRLADIGENCELPAMFCREASEALGSPAICRMEHCWLRRQYAPSQAPRGSYPNSWHQDGGLGVTFPE